ncbi:MAG TPA: cation-translocating P-type ATPase [Pyrinomonadaceae bacterium]|nr:cation-translocating P-type ATPase [Pyrinomonadaceae bacterium]HQX55235.1 cation-translocating P-type ATPase [Pyrinomonadaceae bacterium]HQY66212.1 cation-translocating P-type ATPase [Pyrinomonadaceae bacterium]HRA40253.1 cation-translocating P-type ATPase [Pyrinomonadaceae bacterium]
MSIQNPYSKPVEGVLSELTATLDGLDEAEAADRLLRFGTNELAEKAPPSPWVLLARQFRDFMILILIAAAIISGVMGDLTDTVIIIVIVILNAIIGLAQEYRAEKALGALKKMTVTMTQVIRDGRHHVISAVGIVPGDIVVLEAGNIVPADIRLFETFSFRVDESTLTGESVPVDKTSDTLDSSDATIGDQLNMAFKGTLVTHGRANGIVTSTGMDTEIGRIAGLLHEDEAPTPLQLRMARFGKNLSYLILLICAILFLTGVLRGEEPFQILLVSVSLAVAAIPEALPALITIALSRGASRLARQHALIRKLPAVETLGSVTYICSDKTGTLTQNRMRTAEVYDHSKVDGDNISMFWLGLALNNNVEFNELNEPFGEPTEIALVERAVEEMSIDRYFEVIGQHERTGEISFDSDRKCMTTVHHLDDGYLIVTKGASEAIADCLNDNAEASLVRSISENWANHGMRVLAYAYKKLEALPEPYTCELVERDLCLSGLAGLIDPARIEVRDAIDECRTAGITPVMITGDHPLTAKAIAREIGILDEHGLVLTGPEITQLSDEAFYAQVERTAVYARVSPDQKLRIVRALQHKGHFAAMTGDGVNDAPSLRAANIGIAMGINGTDVSKEAADMILLDDNFATIVKAVKEGRRIFDNIRKFVKYIMTCNGAEILTIFLPPLFGMPIPLLPVHLLWINLVTDGLPALALAGESAEKDVMKRPPRSPGESLFSDGVGYHIVWVGLLMAAVTIVTQAVAIGRGWENWQTMVFTVLSVSQLGHVLAVRSDRTFLFRQGIFTNLPLITAVLATLGLQLAVIYLPFMNRILKTQPLTLAELGFCLAMSAIVFHAVEFEKWIKLRNFRK